MNDKLEPLEEAMEDVAETSEEAVQKTEDLAEAVAAEAIELVRKVGETAEGMAGEADEAFEAVTVEVPEVEEEAGEAFEEVAEATEDKAEEAAGAIGEEVEAVSEKLQAVVIEEVEVDTEASDDDRLMALLAYASQLIIPFIVPIILLISETSKKRPFQRYHAVHSLAVSVVAWILQAVLGIMVAMLSWTCICPVLLGLVMLIIWLMPLYYGILAFQGKRFRIPALSQFLEDQGWL